jgi:hypothetical protein
VRDANGQALSYIYYESEPGRRSAEKLLSEDEARRIASNIAKLPQLVRKSWSRPELCSSLMSRSRLTVCVDTLSALYDVVDLRQ